MVLAGSLLALVVLVVQSSLILAGYLSLALIFVPGGLMSFSQGLSLPNAQADAIRVRPELAGTAAGLGVFLQMLLSAVSTEIYGIVADGTPIPMIAIASIGGVLAAGVLFIGPAARRTEKTSAQEPPPQGDPTSAKPVQVEDRRR